MRHSTEQQETDSSYDLIDSDILFALAMHVLVIGGFILFALYQPEMQKKPLKRIEVTMITAKELAALQRPEKPEKPTPKPSAVEPVKPKPVKEPIAPPKPPAPVVVKPAIVEPLKPIVPKKEMAKPKAEPKKVKEPSKPKPRPTTSATKKPKKSKEPFDPFAPAVSKRSHQTRHAAPKIDKVEMVSHQLSSRELDRYIAMMQAAVQKHWKVPGGLPVGLKNPLVRVELKRDGSIRRITILETSGQNRLDQTLITAIKAAAPFTLPRQQYAVFKSNDIRFHPRKRGS